MRKGAGTYDDEFDYVFEGGTREGDFHKQVRANAVEECEVKRS